jgi:methyl-accepting chemotaxis protein
VGLDANATRKVTGRWGRGLRWKLVALTGGSMGTLGLLGTVVFTWQAREVMRAGALEAGLPLARVDVQILAILKGAFAFGLVAFVACVLVSLLVARMLVTPLERLSVAAAGVARGDLRQDLVVHGHDEVAATSESFRTMAATLREVVADLKATSAHVEQETQQILATATRQAAMASQQAAAIQETSTTVSEIAQTAKQATEHADGVIHIATRSEDLSVDGRGAVEQAKAGIEELGEQVRAIAGAIAGLSRETAQIGEVITTVKDLAEQSNLLALNASIEASKAGDHGRGFAVVAAEIRNLAEQSKAAAGQVRTILGQVQRRTRDAVVATEEGSRRAQAAIGLAHTAGTSIVGLADAIRESSLAARQIADSTRQQTAGVEQIVTAIQELAAATDDNVEGTRRIQEVTANLQAVSGRLSRLVDRWEV